MTTVSSSDAGSAARAADPVRAGSPTRPQSVCEAFQTTAATWADDLALRTIDGSVELTWEQDTMYAQDHGSAVAT